MSPLVPEPEGDPVVVRVAPVPIAVVREQVALEALPDFFDRTYGVVAHALEGQEIGRVGPAVAVYRGEAGATVDVAVGYPVQRPVAPTHGVVAEQLPGGLVARTIHVGPYDRLAQTYHELQSWIAAQGLVAADVMWESYLTEPTPEADPARMLTEVTWLLMD
ncbi:GyrI-like domain-containing protein [Nocardioides campestrisoli]|uniref:GyrI-like domain-containing protein n=1 Tax=Nocardioides campestrisoli TaxID=2736757 RepID=UPI0015E78641|nr:GyrI-like domain-containing protein [Nocardioides campestrisoli]